MNTIAATACWCVARNWLLTNKIFAILFYPKAENLFPRGDVGFTFVQIDDVISQAQTTRAALNSQRTLFGDFQGKVKLLSDKFPIIRGLLGILLKSSVVLKSIFLSSFINLAHHVCRFNQEAAIKRYSHSLCSDRGLYVVLDYLLAFKMTRHAIYCFGTITIVLS